MTAFTAIFLCAILGFSCLYAQEGDSTAVIEENLITEEASGETHQTNPLELEIDQLIIDNTFSKAGGDFQQLFNTRWTWPSQRGEQFIITLSEKPSFLNSTILEIWINELKVFESFLQPRYDILEQAVNQAIEITMQYILNYEDVVKELSGEDLSGSGIY